MNEKKRITKAKRKEVNDRYYLKRKLSRPYIEKNTAAIEKDSCYGDLILTPKIIRQRREAMKETESQRQM